MCVFFMLRGFKSESPGEHILDAAFIGFSPRSGRQHKAWGVSPRSKNKNGVEPAKRATAVGTHASGMLRMSSPRLCTPEACVPPPPLRGLGLNPPTRSRG